MLTITSLKKLFPDWEEGLYEAIVKEAELKQAKAGDVLLKMGQNIKSAMLVVEGTIKLYQEDEDGGEYFMYHLNPGEACAVTLVCNYHHEQSHVLAKAVTDIQYLAIPIEFMDIYPNQYSVKMLYDWVHTKIGIPIVFDQHHFNYGPQDQTMEEALRLAHSTWKTRAMTHMSSSKILEDTSGKQIAHADYIYEEIKTFGLDFDTEIEAKAKDLAVFRYRNQFKVLKG